MVWEMCGWGLTAAGRQHRELVRMQATELFEQGKPLEVGRRLRVSAKSAYDPVRD